MMPSFEPPTAFYDQLAPFYHLHYADWKASVERQGAALESVLRAHGIEAGANVVDVACGIGTQALGLAARGYHVTASDISGAAVARARREAAERGLSIDFSLCDMRAADHHFGRTFDAVLACDNAVPHLLDDDQILHAFQAMYALTRPGGVCLVSVRDYDAESREPLQLRTPMLHELDGTRYVVFQVWKFEGDQYELSMYVLDDRRDRAPRTHVVRTRYYAISTGALLRLMGRAGFQDVSRSDDSFFQPLLIGTRR